MSYKVLGDAKEYSNKLSSSNTIMCETDCETNDVLGVVLPKPS
jgi:hypothetical protein